MHLKVYGLLTKLEDKDFLSKKCVIALDQEKVAVEDWQQKFIIIPDNQAKELTLKKNIKVIFIIFINEES